jgi:hypothetical protein
MTAPDLPAMRLRLARYEGTMSRLCDALWISPDTAKGQPGELCCAALERWVAREQAIQENAERLKELFT